MAIQLRYLGWTAFELTTQKGTRILIDPMLAGRSHDGIAPSPAAVEEFDNVDFVLVTHAAADHVGQTIDVMQRSKATLICDVVTRLLVLEAGGIPEDRIYRMVSGVRFTFDDIAVKALPAQHLSLAKTKQGYVSAQPLSYLIDTNSERVFFGGDTSIHGDLKLFGELYQPHVALLGVGGVNVHGQSLTELYPDEAALAAKWLGVQLAIPMHYRFDEGAAFIKALQEKAPEIQGLMMQPGERYTFSPGG
jgi:L-ascorbate metabolism protein UlaG (beta-lactamase superfamily)